MNRVFKGWRHLRPNDVLRRTDRWTFVPANYKSPRQMLRVDHAYPEMSVAEWRHTAIKVRDMGRGYYVFRPLKK